jgi:hypothetical protein
MKKYLTDPTKGWVMVKNAVYTLVELEALGIDDLLDETGLLQAKLGYSEDDAMDFDSSLRAHLQGVAGSRLDW